MMDIKKIESIWPNIKVKIVNGEHGAMFVLTGKGSKVVANYIARENYLNGYVDTNWRDVRYGLGYAVPLYNNPMDKLGV